MGVDIHCYAEVKKIKWELAQPLLLNEEYTSAKKVLIELYIKQNKLHHYNTLNYLNLNAIQKKEYDSLIAENTEYPFEKEIAYYKLTPKLIPESVNDVRHYVWFAILGCTRLKNIRALEDYIPIKPARGLPQDLSPDLSIHFKTLKKIGGADNYVEGVSWLTLQEIIEFNWDKKIKRFCFIKNPSNYTKSELADPESLLKLIKEDQIIFAQDCRLPEYEKIEFSSTYKKAAGEDFLIDFINQLSLYGTPENVRIVFYFDS